MDRRKIDALFIKLGEANLSPRLIHANSWHYSYFEFERDYIIRIDDDDEVFHILAQEDVYLEPVYDSEALDDTVEILKDLIAHIV